MYVLLYLRFPSNNDDGPSGGVDGFEKKDEIRGILSALSRRSRLDHYYMVYARIIKYSLPSSHWNYSGTLGLDKTVLAKPAVAAVIQEIANATEKVLSVDNKWNQRLGLTKSILNRAKNVAGFSPASNPRLAERRKHVQDIGESFASLLFERTPPEAEAAAAIKIVTVAVIATFLS